jgi:hypothetical protein
MNSIATIPATAKIWVYPAQRPFTPEELSYLQNTLTKFLTSWEAHGQSLTGTYRVIENQFLVLAVDEEIQSATGCSIDKSVALLKNIEQQLGLTLTDRSLVAYKNQSEPVQMIHFTKVKEAIGLGQITPETVIYNFSIVQYGQLSNDFALLAKNSWVSKYF